MKSQKAMNTHGNKGVKSSFFTDNAPALRAGTRYLTGHRAPHNQASLACMAHSAGQHRECAEGAISIMDIDYMIEQAKRIKEENLVLRQDIQEYSGPYVQACEFLRIIAGDKSSFFKQLEGISKIRAERRAQGTASIIQSFIDYVNAGLLQEISIQRQAQIDVVSDLLEQAQSLLDDKKVHPAAPIVLTGASLEESLRNWVEEKGLSLGNKKPSLDSYCKCLREAKEITKQDVKDITSWAGFRNSAAHGKWSEVENRERARLMLEGVNLFMRKYSQ